MATPMSGYPHAPCLSHSQDSRRSPPSTLRATAHTTHTGKRRQVTDASPRAGMAADSSRLRHTPRSFPVAVSAPVTRRRERSLARTREPHHAIVDFTETQGHEIEEVVVECSPRLPRTLARQVGARALDIS